MNFQACIKKILQIFISAIPVLLMPSFPVIGAPQVTGLLDTSIYLYSANNSDLTAAATAYRIGETLLFDININPQLSFHFNNRFLYRSEEYEDDKQLDLNFYYGFFQYILNQKLSLQAGRLMDVNHQAYIFFDGISAQYTWQRTKVRWKFELYGGLNVNDDYLEDDKNIYGLNAFDYRNYFVEQRKGDYVSGGKANLVWIGKVIFSLDYQMNTNDGKAAEQYISLDFDTTFSPK